jgi:hypothetical protein
MLLINGVAQKDNKCENYPESQPTTLLVRQLTDIMFSSIAAIVRAVWLMTLGDAVSRKSLMKMVYRKFPKTACQSASIQESYAGDFRWLLRVG